jgi:cytochrome b pre-mRNA-processing protein 3
MPLLKRLYHFLSKPVADPAITKLYQACITQARRPEFYQAMAVPDTIDGRFDLLLLHVFMVMRKMGDESEAKQQLFDMMFADMDENLREMGVGDMSIAKKMKPMLGAFYGRSQAYEKALADGNEALSAVLHRNLYATKPVSADVLQPMVDYVRHSTDRLEKQPLNEVLSGQPTFAEIILK